MAAAGGGRQHGSDELASAITVAAMIHVSAARVKARCGRAQGGRQQGCLVTASRGSSSTFARRERDYSSHAVIVHASWGQQMHTQQTPQPLFPALKPRTLIMIELCTSAQFI